MPRDAASVSSLLGLHDNQTQKIHERLRSGATRYLRWLSRLGLALVSVISLIYFRLRGHDTLFYTLHRVSPGKTRDFRLDAVYEEFEVRGYRFAEYLVANPDDGSEGMIWRNIWRRRRPVVFFEVLSKLLCRGRSLTKNRQLAAIEIDFAPEDSDQKILEAAANWALSQSRYQTRQVRSLERILRFHKVSRAVLVDHTTVLGKLVAACQLNGVPTLGIMHGNFTRFHSGLFAYGFRAARRHTLDLYGLWTEHYRQRLLAGDLYLPGNTFVSGHLRAPSADEIEKVRAVHRSSKGTIRVLLISEPHAVQQEVAGFLLRVLKDPRFEVKLKIRPGENDPAILKWLSQEAASALKIVDTSTVFEAFSQSDVVAGTHSTVLYEAILAQRPVVVFHTSYTYGHDIVLEGLAELAGSPDEVAEILMQSNRIPAEELLRRRKQLWGEEIHDGASRLFDRAESVLWKAPNPSLATRVG